MCTPCLSVAEFRIICSGFARSFMFSLFARLYRYGMSKSSPLYVRTNG